MNENRPSLVLENERIVVRSDAASELDEKLATRAIATIKTAKEQYTQLAEAAKFIGVDTKFLEENFTSIDDLANGCLGLSYDNELLAIYGRKHCDGTIEVSMIRNLSRMYQGKNDKEYQWGKSNFLWGGNAPLSENDIAIITSDEISAIRLKYCFSVLFDRAKANNNNSSPFADKRLLIASTPSLYDIPSVYRRTLGRASCVLAPAPEYIGGTKDYNLHKDMFVASGLNCVCMCVLPYNQQFLKSLYSETPYKQAEYITSLYLKNKPKRSIMSRGLHHVGSFFRR